MVDSAGALTKSKEVRMTEAIRQTEPHTKGPLLFSTPLSLIIGAILLKLLALTCLFTYIWARTNTWFPDERTQTIVPVLFLILAVILISIGMTMLIVGAVRYAIHGNRPPPDALQDNDAIVLLNSINDRMLLSESTKRITHRHQSLQMLRQTIRQDIAKNDFDAAMVLVGELGQTYGYREESEVYREQITASQTAEQEAKITEALSQIDAALQRHEFDLAERQAEKVQRLYPDSGRVKAIVNNVVQTREQYKHEVERQFLSAAENNDVDHAIGLLKELDRYLTESEAEPFRETARGIIGRKRDNLGVQFKIAVHDHEWLRAVRVGEQIIQEFPNTQMANEVRGMIALLRRRAVDQQTAKQAQ